MEEEIKYADIKELRAFGIIHEINRQLLHPMGLALEISIDDDGNESLGGIWDYREDPEGIYFGELDTEKMQRFSEEFERRIEKRKELLGFGIQDDSFQVRL